MAAVKHDSNTDIFRGQLFLFIGENPIAYGTSATMQISTAEIDISNKMLGDHWKGSLPGQKSFTISSDSLVTRATGQVSFDTLLAKQLADETIEFFIGEASVTEQTATGGKFALDTTKPHYTGTVMITSLEIKSETNGLATCTTSLAGVGALTQGTVTP